MDPHEAQALRRLWIAAACAAVTDAAADVARARSEPDKAERIARHLRYFRSRDGRTVFSLAGIGDPPIATLEEFLRSDRAKRSPALTARACGLRQGKSVRAVQ